MERGIRISEVRFLMGTQNFSLSHARDKTKNQRFYIIILFTHLLKLSSIDISVRILSQLSLFPTENGPNVTTTTLGFLAFREMGTVVQAGICDFRKIIIFHELR